LNHQHYPTLQLTVAQHPSETIGRMLVRLLAYCLHSLEDTDQRLCFTQGLGAVDEPDIWHKGYDEQINLWIDVGEPSYERMKKACRLGEQTYIYSFNSKSAPWWKESQALFSTLPINIFRFEWSQVQAAAKHIQRTSSWSITLSDEDLFITADNTQIELARQILQ